VYSYYIANSTNYWDEQEYETLASHMHQGIYSIDGLHSTAFRPPGYPFILYLFKFISNDVTFHRFCNFVFFGASLLLLSYIVTHISLKLSGILAIVMACLYPLFFYAAGTLYPQIIASFLLLATLALIVKETKYNKITSCFIGFIFGCLILTMPLFLAFIPVFASYPWFFQKRYRVQCCTLFLCLGCLVVGFWSLRNTLVLHQFVLISTNQGINLLIGNSESTTPNSGVLVDLSKYANEVENLDEVATDAYFQKQAFHWIFSNPLKAFKLYLLKVFNTFNFYNELATKKENHSLRNFLVFITYYPLLFLLILRLSLYKNYPLYKAECFILLIYLLSPFITALFFTRLRFRIPFDFLLIILVASFIGRYVSKNIHFFKQSPIILETAVGDDELTQSFKP
jgi:hypothetical protein